MIIKKRCEGWFQFSRETLAPLIEQRNELLHSLNRLSKDMPLNIADNMKIGGELIRPEIKKNAEINFFSGTI